jgi:hypothetical protein
MTGVGDMYDVDNARGRAVGGRSEGAQPHGARPEDVCQFSNWQLLSKCKYSVPAVRTIS